ncbi:preprotein translocase subunit YajC [Porphyromonas levii]|uniref:Sec translocon accessory complex subunit YajC n=2 Tax=Porphyromonas levii TaxID=28114 RepID=A0A4Y8WNS7_9PORP|nr:preprotein translocase subunit YajC [Porphyromonas levii]TFH94943.1 preprotein translocase subunit YajC [Porphyromonas levii]TFH95017.1 preprotein translocase subunit YajC [Porphyromonas levii]
MTLLQAGSVFGNGMNSILMIVLMIAIFYFFIIRPQSKQQKKIQEARKAMKPGDKIMTSGGIYGTIREINTENNQVTIEVWEGVKMKVDFNQVFALTENKK